MALFCDKSLVFIFFFFFLITEWTQICGAGEWISNFLNFDFCNTVWLFSCGILLIIPHIFFLFHFRSPFLPPFSIKIRSSFLCRAPSLPLSIPSVLLRSSLFLDLFLSLRPFHSSFTPASPVPHSPLFRSSRSPLLHFISLPIFTDQSKISSEKIYTFQFLLFCNSCLQLLFLCYCFSFLSRF